MKSWWISTTPATTHLELREVATPQPGEGELLVRMQAAALNRGEFVPGPGLHSANGVFRPAGFEGTGIVAAVGPGVTSPRIGSRVMGRCLGAFSEYGLMLAEEALPVPASMPVEQAAALTVTYLTAHDALLGQGQLKPGETVLLLGAASGVGVAALNIAKSLGAVVLGTSGFQAKLQVLQSLGLDVPLETRGQNLARAVREQTQGRGVDLALNMVGPSVAAEALQALSLEGRLAIVGYVDRQTEAPLDFGKVHAMRLKIFGVSHKNLTAQQRLRNTRKFQEDLFPAIESGRLRPFIDSTFAFSELPAAQRHLELDSHVGKVVLKIND